MTADTIYVTRIEEGWLCLGRNAPYPFKTQGGACLYTGESAEVLDLLLGKKNDCQIYKA